MKKALRVVGVFCLLGFLATIPDRVAYVLAALSMVASLYYLNKALKIRRRPTKRTSPVNATFLLYLFYDAPNCDALVGDLEERYKIIRKKFGARRASFWYWVQVITSVGPITWAATKRLLKAVSGVTALVEMWRRIRG